jgi:DNA ligase-1
MNNPINEQAMDAETVQQLQAVCPKITRERAVELLEAANGSLEVAFDIYFHQQEKQDSSPPVPSSVSASPIKQKKIAPKQANLHSFFQNTKSAAAASYSNQAKLDSFLHATKVDASANKDGDFLIIDDDPAPSRSDYNNGGAQNKSTNTSLKRPEVPEQSPPIKKQRNTKATATAEQKPLEPEVSFGRLAQALQEMTDTTKRLAKLDVLQTLIRDILKHADETEKAHVLTCALQLVLGRQTTKDQAPLDVSGSAVSKSLQTMLGVSRMQLSKAYREYGDLGDSAAAFFQKKSFFVTTIRTLSIVQVYQSLQRIVVTEGRDAKQHILLQLMRSCQTKSELRFLVRLLVGNMRVGANLKTILAALAMAMATISKNIGTKDAVARVQKTHDVCPNLEKIIRALLKGGLEQMQEECGIQVMTPISPMLAHPAHSLEQAQKLIAEKKSSAVLEWKYDGVRCQAHYEGTEIQLFSRNLLETTEQYPDAAQSVLAARRQDKSVDSFILDSEIVGIEGEGEHLRLLPFQDLSRRKRKNDNGKGVQVKIFAFDLMYLNGVSLVNRPLWERQRVLREHFQETNGFGFVSSLSFPSYQEHVLQEFLEEAVRGGAEGVMLKLEGRMCLHPISNQAGEDEKMQIASGKSDAIGAQSPYEAGARSQSWLKVKRDYVSGYADTIDVVPIGACK